MTRPSLAAPPRIRPASVRRVARAAAVAIVCGSVLGGVVGCSSAKKLSQLQTLEGVRDPETGGPLQLIDADSESAKALSQPSGLVGGGIVGAEMESGRKALATEQYDVARSHFEAVLAKQPQHAKAHHFLAVIADRQKRFDQAEGHYKIALEQSGEDAAILSDIGYSYLLQDRFEQSEDYLKRSRAADPTYPHAIGNLGLLYAKKGDREKCLAMYRLVSGEDEAQAMVARLFADRPSLDPLGGSSDQAVLADTQADRIADLERQLADLKQSAANGAEQASDAFGATAATASKAFEALPAPTDFEATGQPAAIAEDRLAASLNPKSLADIGLGAASTASEATADPMAAFLASEGQRSVDPLDDRQPRPAVGLPAIRPGQRGSGGSLPLVSLEKRNDAPATLPTAGAAATTLDVRQEAALVAMSMGSSAGWNVLTNAPAVGQTAAALSGPAPLPTITPSGAPATDAAPIVEPMPDAPVAPVARGLFAGETSEPPTTVTQPPQYDPSQSRASFEAIVPASGTLPPDGAMSGVRPIPTVTPGRGLGR